MKHPLALAAFVLGLASATVRAADPLVGYWLVHAEKDHGGVVELYRNGACIDGRVAHMESPLLAGQPRRDLNNKDAALRGQPILGLTVVHCFKADDRPGHYAGARLYRPEDGNTYSGKAHLSADGKTLTVRGFLGFSLLGQSQTWTRLGSLADLKADSYEKTRP